MREKKMAVEKNECLSKKQRIELVYQAVIGAELIENQNEFHPQSPIKIAIAVLSDVEDAIYERYRPEEDAEDF